MWVSLGVVVSCGVLFLLPESLQAALAFDREAVRWGEVWRLWGGHFVHFSPRHAALDLASLWLVSGIVEREWGGRVTVALYALAPVPISLGLLGMADNLHVYRGSSGLAALFGVAAATSLWMRASRMRPVIIGLGIAVVLKCLVDASAVAVDSSGTVIAWQAHVLGGLLGAVVALWLSGGGLRLVPRPGGRGRGFAGCLAKRRLVQRRAVNELVDSQMASGDRLDGPEAGRTGRRNAVGNDQLGALFTVLRTGSYLMPVQAEAPAAMGHPEIDAGPRKRGLFSPGAAALSILRRFKPIRTDAASLRIGTRRCRNS